MTLEKSCFTKSVVFFHSISHSKRKTTIFSTFKNFGSFLANVWPFLLLGFPELASIQIIAIFTTYMRKISKIATGKRKLVLCSVSEIRVPPWGGKGVGGINHFVWGVRVPSGPTFKASIQLSLLFHHPNKFLLYTILYLDLRKSVYYCIQSVYK